MRHHNVLMNELLAEMLTNRADMGKMKTEIKMIKALPYISCVTDTHA